jgi:Transmembrane domain of unknown function (DUF3566)
VNDTTSNPDDRDGAAVATGEHAAVETNGAHEPGGHEANGSQGGAAGNGAAESATLPSPRPSPRPAAADGPPDGAEPVVEDPPEVPPADPTPSEKAAAEAPTATVQLPGRAGGGSPADDDVTRPVDRSAFQQPPVPAQAGPWTPAPPAPANGPVPGPGPAAAPPPPWQRVPGREQPPPPDRSRPAGGLLDEGPTTFLEAPAPSVDGQPHQQNGAWSGVRAVRNRQPRQAALQLKRLDPWSVLKLALVLAVVLFFIWLVAVGVLYGVLDGMGVWDRLNGTYADLVSGQASTGAPLISAGRVFGLAAIVGAVNSLLFAVAITVGAFVYNVSADLVGGIEVTLSERD